MDLLDYIRVLRKRWRIVTACTLLAIAAAAAVTWTSTPIYQASTQLFVSAKPTAANLSSLAQGGQFTQQRVQSYADIVNSPEVTQTVATQLNDGLTAKQIADEVSATAPLNTVLVNVSVKDASAQRAQSVANAVSDQFATYAEQLETPNGATTSPVKITVVKRAALPTAPVSPRKALNLGLGVLVGLAVGVGGAVLRETLDRSIKDPDQLQRDHNVSMLGAIAFDPAAPKRPLIVQADPRSTRAEAFRQLRTNLQFVDIDRAPRSITVTSSVPEEGKTTTTINLAIALAQSGTRVLLVEADLRRPRMAEYLGIEGSAGLTSVLIGRAAIEDVIQPWGRDTQLHVLPSGLTPPNPSELLGSQGMADLVRDLTTSYDLVLVDAPPLLPVTDAAILSTVTNGTVVIVRYGTTRREQVARAIDSLSAVDATIYGAVLTMTPTKGPDAYYYASGYGYRYEPRRRRGDAEPVSPVARSPRRRGEAGSDYADSPAARHGDRPRDARAVAQPSDNEPYADARPADKPGVGRLFGD